MKPHCLGNAHFYEPGETHCRCGKPIPEPFVDKIKNDDEWGDLVGPNYMKTIRKKYGVEEHEHKNGLMSCSICIELLQRYEKELEANDDS